MKKIFSLLLAAAIFSGCTKYLDVKPYGKVVPTTAEEFSALLHNHLNNLDQGTGSYLLPLAADVMRFDGGAGDDFEASLTDNQGTTLPVYIGTLYGTTAYATPYRSLYQVIRDCNLVINNMEESGTDASRNLLSAAYSIRGVAYYNLMRMYCDAPKQGNMASQLGLALVKKVDLEERPIRSNLEQTVAAIESDFKEAIALQCDSAIYRFTTDVSKGFLARLYFWTAQYDKALPLAQELVKKYPLLEGDDYKRMVTQPYGKSYNHLVKAYMTMSTLGGTDYSFVSGTLMHRPVSKRFLSNFTDEEKTTDIRYALFVNKKRQAVKSLFCGMRAAEFKLMEAECYYHLGDNAKALQALNELRAKRITAYVPLTESTLPAANSTEIIVKDALGNPLTPLMSAIERERRKELFLEGDRFFELKRNGKPQFSTYYNGRRYVTLPYMYTFPIPATEIQVNAAVQQNEGYTEFTTR